MEIKVQSIHFDADDKLLFHINSKIEKLSKFYDRIIGADVFLKLENGGVHIRDKVVEIKLKLPRTTLFAKDLSRSYEDSIDASVENLRKQLVKHKEKIKSKS
ncbi:MAG: ribosome-associated translation inhibitor RaiA [Fimbriimonadaceae bacterium]|nr:ribosome-associated translation inhibitor RaiA [Chitinophagales bacterium]